MTGCNYELVGLALLSVALLISLCLNVVLYIRRKATLCRDECCCLHIYEERPSQEEGHYFHNLNHHDEQQENPHNHHDQQENPIYGNISSDRRGSVEVCYEMMTMQHARDRMKPLDADLNYASLDLKVAKKQKKKHRHQHQQGHTQGRGKLQDQLPAHLVRHANAFQELEADMDAHLPPRDTSTMVSHSSIYLNSQQIAQETEEMGKERGVNMERESKGWEGIRRDEDGRNKGKQEREERKDCSNGNVCTQLSEIEAVQSGTDHFISSFSHESVQQD